MGEKRPKAFLLENVPFLLEIGGGWYMRAILDELETAGYTVHYRILNSRPVIPQRRRRMYFVGFRDAAHAKAFAWPAWAKEADEDFKSYFARDLPEAWPKLRDAM